MNSSSPEDKLLKKFTKIKKTKKNFKGLSKKLTGKDLKRLNSMYIPPAYKVIYLSNDPDNKVQLIANDAKDRKQYFYNPEYTSKSDKRKYKSLRELISIAEQIEKDNKNEIKKIINKKELTQDDFKHIIINLLINNNFRIGNLKYDKLYNSTGITTLKPNHIVKDGNKLFIKFIGKKGVENIGEINDNNVKQLLLQIKKKYGKHNDIDYIFRDKNGHLMNAKDVINYFKTKYNKNITPKMFRTYYANYHMLDYIQNHAKLHLNDTYNKMSETKKVQYLKKQIGEYVSNLLHNTPSICRKKYINNKLMDKIINNPSYYSKLNNNIHEQLKTYIG